MTRWHTAPPPPPPPQLPPPPTPAAAAAAHPNTESDAPATAAAGAAAAAAAGGPATSSRSPGVAPPGAGSRASYFRIAALDHLAAGLAAGTVSTLCLHPFDLLKTRLQVGGPGAALVGVPAAAAAVPYRNSLQATRALLAHEGWTALYKGITPNLVGNTLAWGMYFAGFDLVKRAMSERQPMALVRLLSSPATLPDQAASQAGSGPRAARRHRQLNALEHILAASLTGMCVSALTNPIWVVKTRMFLDHTPSSSHTAATAARAAASPAAAPAAPAAASSAPSYNKGMMSALVSIYRAEGVAGLYRGFIPGLFGVSHGALQFMAYEELKRMRLEQRRQIARRAGGGGNSGGGSGGAVVASSSAPQWSAVETIGMSILSKSFASVATYPYQVVRSRMQAAHGARVPLRRVLAATWAEEGLRGFYRGVWINVVKVMPAACTVFLVYEQVGGYMKRHATYHH